MSTGKVSLKLLIDKSNRTVLFAEAGKDFVDFLLHILTLSVGQVIRLLTKTGMVGSLGDLYGSVEKLNDGSIQPSKKDILLKPKAPAFLSEIPFQLFDNPPDSRPKTSYRCPWSDQHSDCLGYVADDPSAKCPWCDVPMELECITVKSAAAAASAADGKGGFVLREVTYMVMDDLTVEHSPSSTISSITLLKKFNMNEIELTEDKKFSLGMDEGIELLRTSLHSKKVLTDVFLGAKRERS